MFQIQLTHCWMIVPLNQRIEPGWLEELKSPGGHGAHVSNEKTYCWLIVQLNQRIESGWEEELNSPGGHGAHVSNANNSLLEK